MIMQYNTISHLSGSGRGARGAVAPQLSEKRGRAPQLSSIVTSLKYHMILFSWFPNMCISNTKAKQNNSWSQATELPDSTSECLFLKIFLGGMLPDPLTLCQPLLLNITKPPYSLSPPNFFYLPPLLHLITLQ